LPIYILALGILTRFISIQIYLAVIFLQAKLLCFQHFDACGLFTEVGIWLTNHGLTGCLKRQPALLSRLTERGFAIITVAKNRQRFGIN
jgi:hypothetical protein